MLFLVSIICSFPRFFLLSFFLSFFLSFYLSINLPLSKSFLVFSFALFPLLFFYLSKGRRSCQSLFSFSINLFPFSPSPSIYFSFLLLYQSTSLFSSPYLKIHRSSQIRSKFLRKLKKNKN